MHALLTEAARTHDCKYATDKANTDVCVGPSKNTTLQELEAMKREQEDERVQDLLLMEEEMERNATLPKEFHLAPTDKPHYCVTVNEKLGRVNRTLGWNATAEILFSRVHNSRTHDIVEGWLESMSGVSLEGTPSVRFELAKPFAAYHSGSDLPKVVGITDGPPEFNTTWSDRWHLASVGGSPVAPGTDWRAELLRSLPGETRLVLMGEARCATGHPWCDWPCATFTIEPVFKEDMFGEKTRKREHIDAPHGVLRDKLTGYCYSRVWARDWLFQSYPTGIDLVSCGDAEEYVLRQTSFLRDDVFCSVSDPKDCIANIYQPKPIEHAKFVGVDRVATVHAGVTSAREMVRRLRRTVLLFFPCAECRALFGSFELNLVEHIKHPKDAVLWLWRAHNAVNRRLATAPSAPRFPVDNGTTKRQWPPRSLCPECYCRPDPDLDATEQEWKCPNGFNEEHVYHFLVAKYYASDSAREKRFERTELKLERVAAEKLKAERETDLQQAWTAWSPAEMAIVGGRAERAPPEPPAGLVALAAGALLAGSVALLALRPTRRAQPSAAARSGALCQDARGAYQPCGTLLVKDGV